VIHASDTARQDDSRLVYQILNANRRTIIEQSAPYIQTTLDLSDLSDLTESTNDPRLTQLHAALSPYIDIPMLRTLAADSGDLYGALRSDSPPADVLALLDLLAAVLRPQQREQIRSPTDVAALLMVEMGCLDQEELRVVCLTTKNEVQGIVTIYRGSLDAALIRIGEVYKPAVQRNSAALIVVHNILVARLIPVPRT